jgi:uncharacterized HAD superfamily protein
LDYEKDRKILADVDGVLLDWESAYDAWMNERGYEVVEPKDYKQFIRYGITKQESDALVERFNTCAWIGFLKPLRDAVSILDRFSAEHWHIDCITSLSTDHWAGELRRINLERFFGKGCIRRVQCIATGADKDEYLKEYKHSHWWIEDKPENAIAGLKAGHKPILVNHRYNENFEHPDIIKADNWQDIYNIITKSS